MLKQTGNYPKGQRVFPFDCDYFFFHIGLKFSRFAFPFGFTVTGQLL